MKEEMCSFEMEIGQQNAELMHGINCLSQELKWLASCNGVWHPANSCQLTNVHAHKWVQYCQMVL